MALRLAPAVGEDDLPSPGYMSSAPKGLGQHQAGQKSRVFQGGFYQDLHKMLDVSSGGEASPSHPATPAIAMPITMQSSLDYHSIGGTSY